MSLIRIKPYLNVTIKGNREERYNRDLCVIHIGKLNIVDYKVNWASHCGIISNELASHDITIIMSSAIRGCPPLMALCYIKQC